MHQAAWVVRGGTATSSRPAVTLPLQPRWRGCPARIVCENRRIRCRAASETTQYVSVLGEYDFNFWEYMVVLDKPIGLTLAPDPETGKIIVQEVHAGCSAAKSMLIQPGDALLQCSAVFGEDMWRCSDLQRTRWAITNRPGQVKLLLQRSPSPHVPTWYHQGRQGVVSSNSSYGQLPVRLGVGEGQDVADGFVGRGRCLLAAFNSCAHPAAQGLLARMARLAWFRQQLAAAAAAAEVEIWPHVTRMMASSERMAAHMAATAAASGAGVADGTDAATAAAPGVPAPPAAATAEAAGAVAAPPPAPAADSSGASSDAAAAAAATAAAAAATAATAADAAAPADAADAPSASAGSEPPAPAQPPRNGGWQQPGVRVVQLLPWLLVVHGRVGVRDLTRLAAQRALGGITELGLPLRGAQVVEAGAPAEGAVRALLQGAASLHRLHVRRQHTSPSHPRGGSQLLLRCDASTAGQVAVMLAVWLHLFIGLDRGESMAAARRACGTDIDLAQLDAARALLVSEARHRASCVVLTWPYGGFSAEVSGDLVGGWGRRVPMQRCLCPGGCKGRSSRGHFFIELRGLPAGLYHYKFIIDNTWALDPRAPRDLDESGNWNNVVTVRPPPRIEGAADELHFARLQALVMAWAAKLGPLVRADEDEAPLEQAPFVPQEQPPQLQPLPPPPPPALALSGAAGGGAELREMLPLPQPEAPPLRQEG